MSLVDTGADLPRCSLSVIFLNEVELILEVIFYD